jgi:hypothetical protein
VRDKDHLRCELGSVETPPFFGLRDERFHDVRDMADIQTSPMEGAVGRHRRQDVGDRTNPSFFWRCRVLEHNRSRAHPEDHSVATSIKGRGCVLDRVVSSGCSGRQEAGSDPAEQVVGSDVVRRDHHDPPAPAGPDPVLRDRERLGGAGARRVQL